SPRRRSTSRSRGRLQLWRVDLEARALPQGPGRVHSVPAELIPRLDPGSSKGHLVVLQRPDALRERGAEDADFHVRFRDAGLSAEEVAVVVREALQPVELLSGRLRVAEGVEAPALAHAYAEEAALREPPP